MSRKPRTSFEEFDWHLLATAVVLALVGLVFVWSTSHEGGDLGLLPRQLLFLGVSLPLVAFVVAVPYPRLGRLAFPLYALICVVLVLQLLGGSDEARGTQSWIRLPFGFKVQPSEFAKIAVVLALARHLRFKSRPRTFRDLLAPAAIAALPALLIAMQPDLGSASVLVPVAAAMLLASGARLRLLLGTALLGLVVATAVFFSPLLRDYQRARIQAFFVSIPSETEHARELRAEGKHEEARRVERRLRVLKQGTSFQVYHSMISIGSGGLLGQGIGRGRHNRLGYLPERHNDFIFAVVGEEWGLLGCTIVLGLHFLLVLLVLGVARRTRDGFGRLLAVGAAALFASQVFLNTGVATGLLPVTGVTLPFLSSGGSSMVASFLALALVLNVGAHPVAAFDGETYREGVLGGEPSATRSRTRTAADLSRARVRCAREPSA